MIADPKGDFHRLEGALIAALNGFGRPVGTKESIVALRRAVLRARHQCAEQGIQVESLWDLTERTRIEKEAAFRHYAADQMKNPPVLAYSATQYVTRCFRFFWESSMFISEHVLFNRAANMDTLSKRETDLTSAPPVLAYSARRYIAGVFEFFVALAILWGWPSPGGVLGALTGSLFSSAAFESLLASLFPTLAMRIGRMACIKNVYVDDLWLPSSPEHKDYWTGYRLERLV